MTVSTRRRNQALVVGVLVATALGLGAGCGDSSSSTQTGKVTVMQFVHGTVTAVTITTADGQKVQASVPANLAASLRLNQTVEIKKVSGRWVVMQPSGTSTSSGTSTPPAGSTPSTTSTPSTSPPSAASVQACLRKAGFVADVLGPPPSGDRKFGVTTKMEVLRPHGDTVYTIEFFRTATDARHFANTIGGGEEAHGTIAIDAAGVTPDANTIRSCVH